MTAAELRRRRRELRYTQSIVAMRAGVDQGYYSKMESGERPVTDDVVEALDELERERDERRHLVQRAVDRAFDNRKLERKRMLARYAEEERRERMTEDA